MQFYLRDLTQSFPTNFLRSYENLGESQMRNFCRTEPLTVEGANR